MKNKFSNSLHFQLGIHEDSTNRKKLAEFIRYASSGSEEPKRGNVVR